MTEFLDLLTPRGPCEPFARSRRVPAQPEEVPAGKVYLGSDLGMVPWVGVRPAAGDLVTVTGSGGNQVASSGAAVPAMRWPTFGGGCRCRAGTTAGVAFLLSTCQSVGTLVAVDAESGEFLQVFGMPDCGFEVPYAADSGPGLAVDTRTPHDVWVLDDRRTFASFRTDEALTRKRAYYDLLHYRCDGSYSLVETIALEDPWTGASLQPGTEPDPPTPGGNSLSVIDGVPHLTMKNAPAHFLTVAGGVATAHALTDGGAAYNFRLIGNIVRPPQKPAKSSDRFCLATDGESFEIVRFNAEGAIVKRLVLDGAGPGAPIQIAVVCQQLYVLYGAPPGISY